MFKSALYVFSVLRSNVTTSLPLSSLAVAASSCIASRARFPLLDLTGLNFSINASVNVLFTWITAFNNRSRFGMRIAKFEPGSHVVYKAISPPPPNKGEALPQ